MMPTPELPDNLAELIVLALEGQIDPDQFRQLDELLARSPSTRQYYLEFVTTYVALDPSHNVVSMVEAPPPNRPARSEKSVHEPDASVEGIKQFAEQSLERCRAEERRREEELIYKARRSRRRKLMVGVTSMAALLAITLFVWLAPKFSSEIPGPSHHPQLTTPPVVATIAQSVDAQWDRHDFSIAVGTRLTASPISLQRGLVQIVFDDGAEVILQAPCDLVLKTAGRMVLNRGAVSVVVPPRAVGFAIQTPTGIITDHGTEFGVITQNSGATETHVYKGKVVLASVSGISQGVDPVALLQGQAAAVDETGQVRRTPFRAHTIVREMPEEGGFAIPGERLSLADVVGGGNGFGTGELGYGIEPVLGRFGTDFRYDNQRKGNGRYALVPAMPLVDGVFVPDGERGPIQVSSLDHRFTSCPDTTNIYYYCVVNGGQIRNLHSGTMASLVFNGRVYGSLTHPAISMHANLGVTFDLDAIRATLPGLSILRYESKCGISSETPFPAKASFWVLVDGQVQFTQSIQTGDSDVSAAVELRNEDRFLTLVTTDDDSFYDDYCLFATPALILASTTDGERR